jgi:hypothetical protein
MAVKLRSYRNVSAQPLEICEVGKEIKKRVRVEPGEISPLVRVTDHFDHFLTVETGFAVLMDEQMAEDDTPEGYVNITELGDKRPRFRPMTATEREAAGLPPLEPASKEPLPAIVMKPNVAVRPPKPTPAPAPAPAVDKPVS